jgi:hypothetical protein
VRSLRQEQQLQEQQSQQQQERRYHQCNKGCGQESNQIARPKMANLFR